MKRMYILFLMLWFMPEMIFAQDIINYRIGEFELVLLSEGQQQGNSAILIGATPEIVRQCIPNGSFPNATNAFLIKTPGKNILVDTGYGKKLFDNLHSVGINAAQIDIVLITHMHGDHINGLMKEGAVAFPNATVYVSEPEYNYWMSEEEGNKAPENRRGSFRNAREMMSAYKDNIKLFKPEELHGDHSFLLPGIYAVAIFGHTPGHTGYMLESNGEKLLIWADLTHAMAVQMPYPQVAVTYDTDPEQAVFSRMQVLEYVSKHRIPIAGMHIPFPAVGNIKQISLNSYQFIEK